MNKSINLGPLESKLLFELEKRGKFLFDFKDSKDILDTSDSSVANVLYRLREKDRVQEIQKGKYVLNPARSGLEGEWMENLYLIIDHIVDDYYVGFWSAMSYWDLTEQIPVVTQVALTKRKRRVEYLGQEIKFIKISGKRFFGDVKKDVEDGSFYISSLEKTVVDGLTYPQYCGGLYEVSKALWNSREIIDCEKVFRFLNRLDMSAVTRRMGYLLDVLDIKKDLKDKLRDEYSGFRWLDPSSSKPDFIYNKEWGLKLNISDKEMLGWRVLR
ncbi:MAG: type IV toxin-antitoxin system AbiEi family antitoxin [Thermoplasmata archaeon]